MGKMAFVFPGQGAQYVGMGADLVASVPEAKQAFEAADERLGYSLSDLMKNGPEDQLRRTEHTQPAILVVSAVLNRLLREKGIQPDYTAGHSLGEYSALVASGVLDFEDAVYAVRQRGLFMEEAVPHGKGSMAAVLGFDADRLDRLCRQISAAGETVQLANLNAPGQIVISGTAAGVERVSQRAAEAGARRVVPLAVSGPFHSSLMKPAALKLRRVLETLSLRPAAIPIVANSTADIETEAAEIRDHLIEQLYAPVRWIESIERLRALGVDTYVEVGPGRVLSGLIRKIHRGAKTLRTGDLETLKKTIDVLRERE